ncbi:MAG: hypothetical protein IPK18_13250 [Sphingobacteriales bacterium]|jgi:hypothetical protein|nr:MAG: hypothetical protein IPK18_13250 [Sphingobacteriales bacterium]
MTNDINALNLSQQNEIELQKIYTELGISDIKFMLNPSNSVSFDMCVEHTLEMLKDYKSESDSNTLCVQNSAFREIKDNNQ